MKKPLIFVSGKGGVGKSAVAQAIARALARTEKGRRILLVEIGESSFAADHLELDESVRTQIGHKPTATGLGFDLALWSGESCLREYVLHLLKLEKLYRVFFENKVMRALVNVAPGLNDVAILGKITSGLRRVGPPLSYDFIVIDCPSTGHAAALFRAPKGLAQAIQVGPMAHHSDQMVRLLNDQKTSALVTVCLPEEMPVIESVEFISEMRTEFGFAHFAVMNRVLETSLSEVDFNGLSRSEIHPALLAWGAEIHENLKAQSAAIAAFEGSLGSLGWTESPLTVPRFLSQSGPDLIDRIADRLIGESQL